MKNDRFVGILILSAWLPGIAFAEEAVDLPPGPVPAVWVACRTDSDCVVLKGACGEWCTVHRDYAADKRKHVERLMPDVRCLPPTITPEPIALCLDFKCQIKPIEEQIV